MDKTKDILGFGNALVDILVEVTEEEFAQFSLNKGHLNFASESKSAEMIKAVEEKTQTTQPGGSNANTIATMGLLGSKAQFCGKVGNDINGKFYEEEMKNCNVTPLLAKGSGMTGHALIFITPDAERTFSVCLGEADRLTKEDFHEEKIAESKCIHIEGYQLANQLLQNELSHAMDLAKKNQTIISMDLGDATVIEQNLKDFRRIAQLYADILFLNEDEAKAFTGQEDMFLAAESAGMNTDIVIIKRGANGCLVRHDNQTIDVPVNPVSAVDTTGAGDAYAAGFLHCFLKGKDLKTCATAGNILGSHIVEKIGARFEKDPKALISHLI